VFIKGEGNESSIVAAAVDDLTIVANTMGEINEIKDHLRSNFEMTDLGEVSWLLGLDIQRDRTMHTISIGQQAFIDTILARFNLTNARPLSMPMEPGTILAKEQSPTTEEDIENMKDVPYLEALGSLMYVCQGTRFIPWSIALCVAHAQPRTCALGSY
jgi:hypothetical protein